MYIVTDCLQTATECRPNHWTCLNDTLKEQ